MSGRVRMRSLIIAASNVLFLLTPAQSHGAEPMHGSATFVNQPLEKRDARAVRCNALSRSALLFRSWPLVGRRCKSSSSDAAGCTCCCNLSADPRPGIYAYMQYTALWRAPRTDPRCKGCFTLIL